MTSQRDIPTCELGFWKPMHEGCPVCGPDGPCRDPEYELLIQSTRLREDFRRSLWIIVGCVCLTALGVFLVETFL